MLGAWKWYQNQLTKNPVPTQIISSGVLWATGDVAAQYVSFSTKKRLHLSTDKEMKKFKIDWKRVATTSMFGFGFVGPVGHFWYEGLEHVTKHRLRLRPSSLQFVTAKLAADTLIFGPVHLLAFFTYMGLASGKKLDQVKEDVKRDFLPAFMMEGSTWTLVQSVNFRFVPVRYQRGVQTKNNTIAFAGVFQAMEEIFEKEEYGLGGIASIKGDVYGYGILILEMVTRKRPSDDMFVGNMNLQQWVRSAFPNRLADIVDSGLLRDENENMEDNRCLLSFIHVSLLCTNESPRERPSMRDVAKVLESLKTSFMGGAAASNLTSTISDLLHNTNPT